MQIKSADRSPGHILCISKSTALYTKLSIFSPITSITVFLGVFCCCPFGVFWGVVWFWDVTSTFKECLQISLLKHAGKKKKKLRKQPQTPAKNPAHPTLYNTHNLITWWYSAHHYKSKTWVFPKSQNITVFPMAPVGFVTVSGVCWWCNFNFFKAWRQTKTSNRKCKKNEWQVSF